MSLIDKLQRVLEESVASGEECGCQLAVYQHGRQLCSLSAGFMDENNRKKVDENTLFPVFSVGKGVMTALMHVLHEQGFYEYEDLVSKFWPEYACCGKETTRIWHILSHRSGLYSFPQGFPFGDMFQWEKAGAALAGMAPLDTIGGKHHYHAVTYGVLTGRLAELMTGKKLSALFRENIFDVLGIDRIFFGLPEEYLAGVAPITGREKPGGSRLKYNSRAVLCGLNPSSNGCANALSLAKLYASLLPEGLAGKCLLKKETVENATILRRAPEDIDQGKWSRFGLGWALCGPADNRGRMFGHGGACGSEGFADKETGLAVGFTKNKLNETHPNHITRNRISEVLGIPERIW